MSYRCPYPGCNGVDFIEMRPLFRLAKDWRGRLRLKRSGTQVLCTACINHALATGDGIEMMVRPKSSPYEPQADDARPAAQKLPRATFADLGREP